MVKRQEYPLYESEEVAGIETIYQNSALCDDMTITRNIFMGRDITTNLGFMDHKKMEETSVDVLNQVFIFQVLIVL